MLVFDGGLLPAEQVARMTLPPAELLSWAWCTPQEAGERLSARLARRVAAAVQARADHTTAYLEDGR
jgi:hypothetical protein